VLSDGFSHDARNPLNAVIIHLEVLSDKLRRERGELPAHLEKNLKAIRDQVHRMDEFIRRFVDLAAPHRQSEPEFDLAQLLQSVVDQCAHHARLHRCELRAELTSGSRLLGSYSELGIALCLLITELIQGGAKRLLLRTEPPFALSPSTSTPEATSSSAGGAGRLRFSLEGEGLLAQEDRPHFGLEELRRIATSFGGLVLIEPGRLSFDIPAPRAEPDLRLVQPPDERAVDGSAAKETKTAAATTTAELGKPARVGGRS
jgi:hypothetical protein